jgi:hypothetical protein
MRQYKKLTAVLVVMAALCTLLCAGSFTSGKNAASAALSEINVTTPIVRKTPGYSPWKALSEYRRTTEVVWITVENGNSLSQIAETYYGTGNWNPIFQDNRSVITNPNIIYPGMRLAIPQPRQANSTGTSAVKNPPRSSSAYISTGDDYNSPVAHPVQNSPPVNSGSSWQSIVVSFLGNTSQAACLDWIIMRESGGNVYATNSTSGAYGIPQALPGYKMASAGSDWRTSAYTQIKWMIGYVNSSYGSACNAQVFHEIHGWY